MSGQIFISYRREDGRWSARSLYERLSARFDRKQIFMDIDAIALGDDFVTAIEKTVGECDVLIAVIGTRWLNCKDEEDSRRLDNPEDFVRREIATALKRDIRVIPVLVDGASMPRSIDLPDDLKPLVRRNALRISDAGFDDDCRRLTAAIEQVLEKTAAEQRERQEKERLEAERHEREEKERQDVERRQNEEKTRLQTQQHQRDEKERLDAKQHQGDSENVIGMATHVFKEGQNLNFAISAETIRDAIAKSAFVARNPNQSSAYSIRASEKFKNKDWQGAIAAYTEEIRLQPNSMAYFFRGCAYYNLKQYSNAVDDYTKALWFDRDAAMPYLLRGIAYYELKQYNKAIGDYTEFIRLEPNVPLLYESRANAYDKLGTSSEAAQDRKRAKELRGGH
jgi:tetratricopeptide (TPR) repeat protein